LLANLTRLTIAAGGGWLALQWDGDLSHLFAAQGTALVAFGLIIAAAVAGGALFGRPSRLWWRQPKGIDIAVAPLGKETP
jgi:lysylphosphatidylglycerol synthetase-like protein (DUF2156 family)